MGDGEISRYSITTTMIAYSKLIKNEKFLNIELDDLDFSKFFKFMVPLTPSDRGYEVFGSVELVSQLSQFSVPTVSLEDLRLRSGMLPTKLQCSKTLHQQMKEFVYSCKGLNNDNPLDEVMGYTWYTRLPIPFSAEQEKVLSAHPPSSHSLILNNWDSKGLYRYVDKDTNLFYWEKNDLGTSNSEIMKAYNAMIISRTTKQKKMLSFVQGRTEEELNKSAAWEEIVRDVNERHKTVITSQMIEHFVPDEGFTFDLESLNQISEDIGSDKPSWLSNLNTSQNAESIDSDEEWIPEEEDENDLYLGLE